jgi:cytochrome c oxidase subunit 2
VSGFRTSLPEASLAAQQVDSAFLWVSVISGLILLALLVLIVLFAVRYRKDSHADRGRLPKLLRREIEIGWTVGTTFLAIFIFWWYVAGQGLPPRAAAHQLEIHVVAKQWMWKTQHPDGAREIDALHIPVGRQVRLVMTSQDVIHSFFVPAFRLKQDVLPDRSTELVFTPTETGTFELFCAEYCGTQHSHMEGKVVVMAAGDYRAWLRQQPHGDTLAREGEALYAQFGCGACHAPHSRVRAPKLDGLFGNTVVLQGGARVKADDDYLKAAILTPRAQVVAGYEPIMPSYAALAKPADVDALVGYIKSLKREAAAHE